MAYSHIQVYQAFQLSRLPTWKYTDGFLHTNPFSIVTSLMSKFAYDLPPVGTKYKMPKMDTDANGLLSLSEYAFLSYTSHLFTS